MNKGLVSFGAGLGGIVGSYIPVWLWHAGELSGWSIVGGMIGGVAGIWAAVKLASYY